MKPNELMIGDWLWYQGRANAFPFRVEQLTKKKVGYHAVPCECWMHYLRLSECQPIAVTSDALERNGFRKQDMANPRIEGQHQFAFWQNMSTSVCLWTRELHDDPKDGWMLRIDSASLSVTMAVRYIHQLQHALRLCGIEKEIAL